MNLDLLHNAITEHNQREATSDPVKEEEHRIALSKTHRTVRQMAKMLGMKGYEHRLLHTGKVKYIVTDYGYMVPRDDIYNFKRFRRRGPGQPKKLYKVTVPKEFRQAHKYARYLSKYRRQNGHYPPINEVRSDTTGIKLGERSPRRHAQTVQSPSTLQLQYQSNRENVCT